MSNIIPEREPILGVDTVYSRPQHVDPLADIGGTETYLNNGHSLSATGIRKKLLVPTDGDTLALYGESFCRVTPVFSNDPGVTIAIQNQGFTPPNVAQCGDKLRICEPIAFTGTHTTSGFAAAVRVACNQAEALSVPLINVVETIVTSTVLASDGGITSASHAPTHYAELIPLDAEPTIAHIAVDRTTNRTTLVGNVNDLPSRAEYAGTVAFGPARCSELGLIHDLVKYSFSVDPTLVKKTGSSIVGLVVNSSSDITNVNTQQAPSDLIPPPLRINMIGE